jgi:lysophospholipase L1-like esterase
MKAIALFGDSIANGFGIRGRPYGQQVADALGLRLLDLSASARQITQWRDLLTDDFRPDVAIIAHGITEAIVRPTPAQLRRLPRRWRAPGEMDPRAYYSSRLSRRVLERGESALRWRVRVALIRTGRTHRLTDPDVYEDALRQLVSELEGRGTRVVILGPPDLDEKFYPGTPASFMQYMEAARRVGGEFVPLSGRLDRWADYCPDRLHPNQAGHTRVGRILLAHLAARDPANSI